MVKRFRLWIVLFWTKNVTTSHYIYYLATDNIHIVLENDNTVLIKGLKKVVNVKLRNTHLIETSYDIEIREIITFQQYRENLAKAGVFRWLQISMNIWYYYTFDNSLLFTESIQNTTQNLSTLIITSGFFRVSTGRWHNAIRVRAKPQVYQFYYSRIFPAEKFPVRLWT